MTPAHSLDHFPAERPADGLPLAHLAGAIVLGANLAAALLFQTYSFEVTPLEWEVARHFNWFFLLCEIGVCVLAAVDRMNLQAIWSRLSRPDKAALLIWFATFWVGSVFSQQPGYSVVAVASWPIHILFGVSIWHLASNAHAMKRSGNGLLIKGAIGVVVCLLVITAAHFARAPDPSSLPGGEVFWIGAIPGFMGVRLFGVVMAYAALFGAGVLFAGPSRRDLGLAAALLMLGFGALCWSSTRAGVVALFVALLAVPILAKRFPPRRFLGLVCALLTTAFGISLLIPAPADGFGTLGLFGELAAPAGPLHSDLSGARMDIWRASMWAILERPIFGHGEGSTRWLIAQETAMHVQPHNVVLQIFQHWGALAALAAIWLALRSLAAGIAAVRQDEKLLPYILVVVAAAVAALFDGALYYPQMVMIPVAALAFLIARKRSATNRL